MRAIFGTRVRALLNDYSERVEFSTPDICFREARSYIPGISARQRLDPEKGFMFLEQLTEVVKTVDRSRYEVHEAAARRRIASRDIKDWPIIATSLLLKCPVWTEDQDFFGSGISTWTTRNVEIYLQDA